MSTTRKLTDEMIAGLEAKAAASQSDRAVREARMTPLQRKEAEASHRRFRDRMASSLIPSHGNR